MSARLTTPGNIPAWLGALLSAIPVTPLVAVVIGALGAAVLARVTGPAIFRIRGHYFAVGTLALAAIIQVIMTNARG